MFIAFPLIAFILLFLIFHKNESWRSAVLSAAISWGFLVTVLTETLSLFKLISFTPVLAGWVITDIVLIFIYRVIKKTQPIEQFNIREKPPFFYVLLAGVAFIVATIGLIAIVAPPNNWDSMAYHMPRLMHWIQNRTVDHYPTNYLPQLYQSPWAEFTIMHFQILSGSDRFANLVQWFSMIGSLIGVSLIAKELGANLLGQIFSSVFCATIPMGILQASSTKNDYVVAFWLVFLAYYVLTAAKSNIEQISYYKIGASFGLAIFTKGTAYIYSLPFLIWFILALIKQFRWRITKPVLTVFSLAFLINLGHYTRNLLLFGSPLYSPPEYEIDVISIPTLISNIIRNMALHMAIPFGLVNNESIEKAIINFHNLLGLDVNDPRITSPGVTFGIQLLATFEDTASNPFHYYLILLAIATFIGYKKIKKPPYFMAYLIALIAAFILFCLLLKWQPWQSRLHITLFVLFSAFVGVVLSKLPTQRIAIYTAITLMSLSLFWVFYNESRPIIGEYNIFNQSRIDQYFNIRSDLRGNYKEAVQFIKNRKCSEVGLSSRPDAWEYPLWVLLQKDNKPLPHLQHINIQNISSVISNQYPQTFNPCAIISLKLGREQKIVIKNDVYITKWSGKYGGEPINVLVRDD